MIDLTGPDVLISLGSVGAVVALAVYIGRKVQSIDMHFEAANQDRCDLRAMIAIVEEHCRRLSVIETHLEHIRRDHPSGL